MPAWYPGLRQPAHEHVGTGSDLQPQGGGPQHDRRALLCVFGRAAENPAETDEPVLIPSAIWSQFAPEACRAGQSCSPLQTSGRQSDK